MLQESLHIQARVFHCTTVLSTKQPPKDHKFQHIMVGSLPYHVLHAVSSVKDTSTAIKTRVRSRSSASETPRTSTLQRSATDYEVYQKTRMRSRSSASQPPKSLGLITDFENIRRGGLMKSPEVIIEERTVKIQGRNKSDSIGSVSSTASTASSRSAGNRPVA